MASGDISIDPDETVAAANAWLRYADQLEQHSAPNPSEVEQLNALGDVYHDFKAAKQNEWAARRSAYQRVANHARLHSARLQATLQAFNEQDAAGAESITATAG